MEAGRKIGLAEELGGVRDPRQAGKVEHDLVEMLVVAVAAVLAGADIFVEIGVWANEKLDWLKRYLKLAHGIASHDTFGRLFAAVSADGFGVAFRCWVSRVLPAPGAEEIVAIDGKTGRRSGKVGGTPSYPVSGGGFSPWAASDRRQAERENGGSRTVGNTGGRDARWRSTPRAPGRASHKPGVQTTSCRLRTTSPPWPD